MLPLPCSPATLSCSQYKPWHPSASATPPHYSPLPTVPTHGWRRTVSTQHYHRCSQLGLTFDPTSSAFCAPSPPVSSAQLLALPHYSLARGNSSTATSVACTPCHPALPTALPRRPSPLHPHSLALGTRSTSTPHRRSAPTAAAARPAQARASRRTRSGGSARQATPMRRMPRYWLKSTGAAGGSAGGRGCSRSLVLDCKPATVQARCPLDV